MMIFLALSMVNCRPLSDYEKLAQFVTRIDMSQKLCRYSALVVINENGTCINCNFAFAKAMAAYVDVDSVLFMVSSYGQNIDISGYLNHDKDNVLFDQTDQFSTLNLIETCGIIEFRDQQIDTIIEVKLDNIQKSIDAFNTAYTLQY